MRGVRRRRGSTPWPGPPLHRVHLRPRHQGPHLGPLLPRRAGRWPPSRRHVQPARVPAPLGRPMQLRHDPCPRAVPRRHQSDRSHLRLPRRVGHAALPGRAQGRQRVPPATSGPDGRRGMVLEAGRRAARALPAPGAARLPRRHRVRRRGREGRSPATGPPRRSPPPRRRHHQRGRGREVAKRRRALPDRPRRPRRRRHRRRGRRRTQARAPGRRRDPIRRPVADATPSRPSPTRTRRRPPWPRVGPCPSSYRSLRLPYDSRHRPRSCPRGWTTRRRPIRHSRTRGRR